MNPKIIRSFLGLSLLLFGIFINSTLSGMDLKGYVKNPEMNALHNAHVIILNTSFGVVTDSIGFFRISNLSPGNYTIQISYLGYETLIKEIEVSDAIIHDFILIPGTIQLNQGSIVSASRFQSNKFSSPLSINSINIEELEGGFPRTTPESLMSYGGWVQKTNHGGGSPFVRGLTGYHTLLMIDGIRLNNATFRSGPNQYLNTIDPLILSGIEIVRSSGSVQYGSDALGGTIHLFTKSPDFSNTDKIIFEPHIITKYVSQGINGNNSGMRKKIFPGMERIIRGEAKVAGKNIAFYGGFGFKKFNDLDASAILGTLSPTGYDEYNADAKLLIRKDKHNITGALQLLQQNNVPLYHNIVSGTYSIFEFDPQLRSLIYLKHEYLIGARWARKISTTLFTQQSVEKRQKQLSGVTNQTHESDKVTGTGVTVELFSTPSKYWSFTSGLDLNYDKVKSCSRIVNEQDIVIQNIRGLYPDNSQSGNIALFSMHQFEFKKVILNAGLRQSIFQIIAHDPVFSNTSLTSSALVGNIGLSYSIADNVRLVSMLNTGFRAPNINDVSSFGITDFRYEIPNADLKPERSVSYEFGLKQKSAYISASLSVFRTVLTNLMVNVPTAYLGQDSVMINQESNEYIRYFHKENINKASVTGFEAESEFQLYRWLSTYIRLYYTFGQDLTKNKPLTRIPPLNGIVGVNLYPIEYFRLRAELMFAGKQDRLSDGDISDKRIQAGGTPGWNIINITAGYTGFKWFDINGGVNNLTDTAFRIHGSGVDSYGRNIWLGIKLNL